MGINDAVTAAQAKWKRLFPKWSKQFLVDPADPKSGTWLDSKWGRGLAVGCKCCSAACSRSATTASRLVYSRAAGGQFQEARGQHQTLGRCSRVHIWYSGHDSALPAG
jgi:hypothetical protein